MVTFERAQDFGRAGKGLARRLAASAAVLAALAPVVLLGIRPAGAEIAPGFGGGTVHLTGDLGGRPLLSMENAAPGDTVTSYTTLAYSGSLPAEVRLYAATSTTGLARFLTVTITRGVGEGPSFLPDPADHTGAGPGVLYRGTLAGLPSTFEEGIPDPGTWTTSEGRTYRFEATLADDPRAAGLAVTATFFFEARSA